MFPVKSASKINSRSNHTEVLFEKTVEKDFGKVTGKKFRSADYRVNLYNTWLYIPEGYSRDIQKPVQHLKMKCFAKIVNSFKLLTIFAKIFV